MGHWHPSYCNAWHSINPYKLLGKLMVKGIPNLCCFLKALLRALKCRPSYQNTEHFHRTFYPRSPKGFTKEDQYHEPHFADGEIETRRLTHGRMSCVAKPGIYPKSPDSQFCTLPTGPCCHSTSIGLNLSLSLPPFPPTHFRSLQLSDFLKSAVFIFATGPI